jgi:hypothetical protein
LNYPRLFHPQRVGRQRRHDSGDFDAVVVAHDFEQFGDAGERVKEMVQA